MIESFTNVIYGWGITENEGKDPSEIYDQLVDLCENEGYDSDELIDECLVFDFMCGHYIYFGGFLGRMNNDEDDDARIEIEPKTLDEAMNKYLAVLKKYPKLIDFFEPLKDQKDPHLFVVLERG